MVKSHEYISRTILKNFSKRNGKARYFAYVKVPNKKIRTGNIKDFNAEEGIYSDNSEHILDQDFEQYMGELMSNINASLKKGLVLKRIFLIKIE